MSAPHYRRASHPGAAAALSWRHADCPEGKFLAGLVAERIGAAFGEQIGAWWQDDDPACSRDLPKGDISVACDLLRGFGHQALDRRAHV